MKATALIDTETKALITGLQGLSINSHSLAYVFMVQNSKTQVKCQGIHKN